MTGTRTTGILSAALIGAVAASAAGQSSFVLRGTVRDFRAGHPDFGPGLPTGHVAGNVALSLSDDGPPAFAGAGLEVNDQWRDRLAHPIAPNMYNAGAVSVDLASAPMFSGSAYADSYDSTAGPYDPATAGTVSFNVGAPMPVLTEPTLSVPHEPLFYRDKKKTTVLTDDLHVDEFNIRTGHTVEIDGDVTILVEDHFELNNKATIQVRPGGSLKLYLKGVARIEQTSGLNEAYQDPKAIEIFNLGTDPFVIRNHNMVYASLVSPNAPLEISNNTDFFGSVIAQSIDAANSSAIHIDGVPSLCSVVVEDTAGAAGGAGATITSADSFRQWFNDVPGINASRDLNLVFRESGGQYEHSDDTFLPIDGKLYGDEGEAHNYYFTWEASATFTYQACAGQSIWFEGADDCWIYVDDKLVIDLGGVMPGTGQFAELDRLRLTDGDTYTFRIYYAQRRSGPGLFNLRTNFPLVPDPVKSSVSLGSFFD
ncbi:MAG: fibro-slime domain-containing protein [Phycisphaerales bacterium JB039]